MQLSVYLFDEDHVAIDGIGKRIADAGYTQIVLDAPGLSHVRAYKKTLPPRTPDWVQWVSPWVPIDPKEFGSSAAALVLLLNVDERVFGIPFGFGHTAIDRSIILKDFGFQLAMRVVNPVEVNLVDVRTIDKRARQKRSVLPRRGTLSQLDVAVDKDLAFKLVGASDGIDFEKRVMGGSSFTFSLDTINKLTETCKLCLLNLKKPVKKDFEEMNRFEVEKDLAVRKKLDEWLLDQMNSKCFDSISIALPDVEVTLAAQYAVCANRHKEMVPDLLIEPVCDVIHSLCGTDINLDTIMIKGVDDEDRILPKMSFTLRECLVAEKAGEGENKDVIHIFSQSDWWRILSNYIDAINAEVERIPRISADQFLPPCEDSCCEDKYNTNTVMSARNDCVCLHTKDFREGLGRSSIEVCDIYTNSHELVCVKPYHSSQTLSHLFSQGSVSANCLRNHIDYREYFCTQIGNIGQFDAGSFNESDFTVVYAIIMDAKRSLPGSLPFFSKVNLLDHVRIIKGLGFNVKLYQIPVVPSNLPKKVKVRKVKGGRKPQVKPRKNLVVNGKPNQTRTNLDR